MSQPNMKAARWYRAHDIRIETVDVPAITDPHQVRVRVAACGICGSDLHEYAAGPIFIPVETPHPLSHDRAPIIMGHEFAGEVVAIGDAVTRVSVGDRVAIEPILSPHREGAYLMERYNLTPLLGFHGLSGGGGGFAEFTVVGEHMVHPLPDALSYEQGALVEPAAVGLHAVRQSSLKAGDTAVVFGAGPIGLMVIESLKAAGAARIFAVEVSETRRQRATELGATVFDPGQDDVVERLKEATGGGLDVAFEVTGIPAVLNQAILSTHPGGETVIVSIWESEAAVHPNDLVIQERTVKGIIAYRHIYPAVIALMQQGYYRAEDLVTARIALDDVVAQGFEALLADKAQVKILVQPARA
ncbi:(R,R)-butanediol dehydrogenase/meso-butanediol dehydrogenase/diacetyl reductase [Kushneria sinocarnis]|uniref:(R,R)-butanediol dehydrogenase/meso-butanediol dehydrogenase/diacetyl reductase n=1 Tax=Kushneria sinocarnis TaxID=595502 RepID=A0A420WZD2_9GAMM|nr:2,3-butanediol dehydrogenase [Kushneria sinocarnis]RKR06706.1 (R,R)-butanediol dehydrogenase/meso-butanediol dehydrogenase/diacetyl reductase [Kushneria sinocarnis]